MRFIVWQHWWGARATSEARRARLSYFVAYSPLPSVRPPRPATLTQLSATLVFFYLSLSRALISGGTPFGVCLCVNRCLQWLLLKDPKLLVIYFIRYYQ